MKKTIIFLMAIVLLFSAAPISQAAEPTTNSYFYNNDGQAVVCPQPYIASEVFGHGMAFSKPIAMTIYEGEIYILNGDGSIVVLNESYQQERVIVLSQNNVAYPFIEVKGFWVSEGEIFIADRSGGVVVRSDLSGNVTRVYSKPIIGNQEMSRIFTPTGVVTDKHGDIYIMVENEYRGLVVINREGEFRGYFGANTVEVTANVVLDNLWRKYFLSETQISSSNRNLPSPYLTVTANEGFVYSSNTGFTNKIRKLNYNGKNILNPSGTMGDFDSEQKSRFVSLAVDEQGFITALESEKKQVFQYDSEGNLLYTFGGLGNIVGSFVQPVSVCVDGNKLLVLDAGTSLVTVFVLTEFGANVREFRLLDIAGRYDEASEKAIKTLEICNEYEAAYYSLAQHAYSNEEYMQSMEYFKACNDQSGYSKAFEGMRIAILTKLFPFIVLGIVILMIASKIASKYRKEPDDSIVLTKKRDLKTKIKYAWYIVFHPIEGYSELRYNQLYSLPVANVLYFLSFLSVSLKLVSTGYTFSTADATDYNLIICLVQSIGVLVVFVICNRLVATFLAGVGTLKELWITVGYAQIPVILANTVYTVLSNVLTAEEGVFLGYMLTIATAYTYIMMFFAVMGVHIYSFKNAVISVICTIFGMLVCVFLVFLLFNLAVEFMGFAETLFKEIIYRINFGF